MPLSPQERADFDAIVARLRLEDTGLGTVTSRRRSMTLFAGALFGAVMLGLAAVLVEHDAGAFGPVMVATAMLAGMVIALRACARSR
ncbi:MAG TPA: hypothetical protein VGH89_05245 [Pseudonocardia sp.]|jgi:hypothetical protein